MLARVDRGETLRSIGALYGIALSSVHGYVFNWRIRKQRLYGDLSDVTARQRRIIMHFFPGVHPRDITIARMRLRWDTYTKLRYDVLKTEDGGVITAHRLGTLLFGERAVNSVEDLRRSIDVIDAKEKRKRKQCEEEGEDATG